MANRRASRARLSGAVLNALQTEFLDDDVRQFQQILCQPRRLIAPILPSYGARHVGMLGRVVVARHFPLLGKVTQD